MLEYFIIGYIGVALTAIAQIVLKYGAMVRRNSGVVAFFFNFYTILGYSIFLFITLLNLYIFRFLDLKYALVFLPSSYILVFLLSVLVLKEKVDRRKLIQYAIVLFGIVIFNI